MLLRELANAGHVTDATLSARATPLLHALTAAHAYILMFVHTCRVGQVSNAEGFIYSVQPFVHSFSSQFVNVATFLLNLLLMCPISSMRRVKSGLSQSTSGAPS